MRLHLRKQRWGDSLAGGQLLSQVKSWMLDVHPFAAPLKKPEGGGMTVVTPEVPHYVVKVSSLYSKVPRRILHSFCRQNLPSKITPIIANLSALLHKDNGLMAELV